MSRSSRLLLECKCVGRCLPCHCALHQVHTEHNRHCSTRSKRSIHQYVPLLSIPSSEQLRDGYYDADACQSEMLVTFAVRTGRARHIALCWVLSAGQRYLTILLSDCWSLSFTHRGTSGRAWIRYRSMFFSAAANREWRGKRTCVCILSTRGRLCLHERFSPCGRQSDCVLACFSLAYIAASDFADLPLTLLISPPILSCY